MRATGYDMSIEQPDKRTVEAYAAVQSSEEHDASPEVFREAILRWSTAREQAGDYFRLNIWGMGEYRQSMDQCGMLYAPDADEGAMWRFPSADDFDVERDEQGFIKEDSPGYAALVKASDAVRDHDHGRVGIPIWKLGSNDGWLVTENECAGALERWQEYVDDEFQGDELMAAERMDRGEPEYWLKWIAFIERASTHGGFRVW